MEDKCPKCGETLLTKTIQKKLGSGSIDYPIAATCPKCKWSKDLTGAGDIVGKPVMAEASAPKKEEAIPAKQPTAKQPTAKQPTVKEPAVKEPPVKEPAVKQPASPDATPKPAQSPGGTNALIPIILAILVVGAIAWVFLIEPAPEEQVVAHKTPAPTPVPTSVITQTPDRTSTSDPAPEVTATGKDISVYLETKRGIYPKTVTIKPGDNIIWTNDGTYAVTLVSSEGLFEDKFLNNAKRTNYTFLRTGTFSFYLKQDKSLTGTIVVEP